jgi:broad specificity phosphatase PhoE
MLPCAYLVRHGETAWSASGKHTGRTDLPLTEEDGRKARGLRERLKGGGFDRVLTSWEERSGPGMAPRDLTPRLEPAR